MGPSVQFIYRFLFLEKPILRGPVLDYAVCAASPKLGSDFT